MKTYSPLVDAYYHPYLFFLRLLTKSEEDIAFNAQLCLGSGVETEKSMSLS